MTQPLKLENQSPEDLLQLAQGMLLTESAHQLLLTGQVTGYRAQCFLEEQPGKPGNRLRLTVDTTDPNDPIVFIGAWEERGIFTVREPMTETEKQLLSDDWRLLFQAPA